MFQLIKPGYVLEFGVCPSQIISPPGANIIDNTRIELWPDNLSNLGNVRCLSHPLGTAADAAAFVANNIRTGGDAVARAQSYSTTGNLARAVTFRRNVAIGSVAADFVGYMDGQTNYVESQGTVFSKDFSGCLMPVFTRNGNRCVAHVAASRVAESDCKHTFLHALSNDVGAQYDLIGWFQPFVAADEPAKINRYLLLQQRGLLKQVDHLVTFGVVTGGNAGYSLEAFRPNNQGRSWVVTNVASKVMNAHGHYP